MGAEMRGLPARDSSNRGPRGPRQAPQAPVLHPLGQSTILLRRSYTSDLSALRFLADAASIFAVTRDR
jgi:hypothetical protein